jgi:hypothetical protein
MRFGLLLLVLPFLAAAQTDSTPILIIGKVINAQSGEPLPYAHVGIPERGIGTATGFDGVFRLKLPRRYSNSQITVSHIGFAAYQRKLSQLERPLRIALQPNAAKLQEVIVMDESRIEGIIRRAVRRIPENYPSRPSNLRGFYRESRTNADGAYVYLAEGVLDIYKTSYQNKREGQVGLVQGRKVALTTEEAFRRLARFSSGHLAADRFDIVKNRSDFLDEDYFPAYQYWLENLTTQNGRPVYVIGFDRAGDDTKARMKGKLFIDTLSYAFVRAEFEILSDSQEKFRDYPFYTGNWRANRYLVNYRQTDGKWHFGDALREGMYQDSGYYTNEIIITEVLPGRGEAIPYLERLERNERFLDITGQYDAEFWASYNTAPINDPKLAERLEQFKNQEKAQEVFDTAYLAQLQRQRDSIQQVESPSAVKGDSLPYVPGEDLGFRTVTVNQGAPIRFQFNYGLGGHFLRSPSRSYRLAYLDGAEGSAIIESEGAIDSRAVEIRYQLALDLVYRDWLLLRWGTARDFGNSLYQNHAIGLGAQFNLLPKRRPLFVRPVVQYSRLFYGRRVGIGDNDFGEFEADDKNFKANKVRMYYGGRHQYLNFSLEFALELAPISELFLRAGYHLPLQRSARLLLKEKGRLFIKQGTVPVSSGQVVAERDGVPYDGAVIEDVPSFSLSFGLLLK